MLFRHSWRRKTATTTRRCSSPARDPPQGPARRYPRVQCKNHRGPARRRCLRPFAMRMLRTGLLERSARSELCGLTLSRWIGARFVRVSARVQGARRCRWEDKGPRRRGQAPRIRRHRLGNPKTEELFITEARQGDVAENAMGVVKSAAARPHRETVKPNLLRHSVATHAGMAGRTPRHQGDAWPTPVAPPPIYTAVESSRIAGPAREHHPATSESEMIGPGGTLKGMKGLCISGLGQRARWSIFRPCTPSVSSGVALVLSASAAETVPAPQTGPGFSKSSGFEHEVLHAS